MTFVAQIVVGSDTQQVSFGSLNGDADQVYNIECLWVPPTTGGVFLALDPNGAAANQLGNVAQAPGTTTTVNFYTSTSMDIARSYGANGKASFLQALLYAKSGLPRLCTAWQAHSHDATDVSVAAISAGVWSNTVDNITSLAIVSSVAAGIRAGSVFRLFKR